jgi:uncharacterized integral membrane protein
MQFLKTLFWFLLAVIVAVFSIGNWTTVPIKLWAGLVAEVNLPLLLVLTFLAGLFPVLLYHHAVKWRLKQKLSTAERAVADLRAANASTAAAAASAPPTTLSTALADAPAAPSASAG